MHIVQITPGAGKMFCGGCFRDNALVRELLRQGHHAMLLPLYLPLTLDEADQSQSLPVFYGGINVFLEHKSSWYRRAPNWLRKLFNTKGLLSLAAGRAASTRPEATGDLTLSMIRGEEGNQARELEELIGWLKQQSPKPDVICLSNGLLIGMARRLRKELGVPVVCMLQGEDTFLDGLPEWTRQETWSALASRCAEADGLVAASHYYGELMARRLGLAASRVQVVHNGINLDGWQPPRDLPAAPTLGYFSRMNSEKGLDTLVEAYLLLKKWNRVPGLRLKVGGGMSPKDASFVEGLVKKLQAAGCADSASFHPNVSREDKIAFYQSLTVMSAPALYGEAFGLYVVESMAAGVPVVQPRHGAFPELIEASGGGLITDPTPLGLANGIESLLLNPPERQRLSLQGLEAVKQNFSVQAMAEGMVKVFSRAIEGRASASQAA